MCAACSCLSCPPLHLTPRTPTHPPFLPLQVAKTLDEKVSRFLQVMLDACAYAGTGDVLKVQQLLAIAGEHPEGEAAAAAGEEGTAWKTLHQSGGCPAPGVPAGCLPCLHFLRPVASE